MNINLVVFLAISVLFSGLLGNVYLALDDSIEFDSAIEIIDRSINDIVDKSGPSELASPWTTFSSVTDFAKRAMDLFLASEAVDFQSERARDFIYRYLILVIRCEQGIPEKFKKVEERSGEIIDPRILYLKGTSIYLKAFSDGSMNDKSSKALVLLNRAIEISEDSLPHAYWVRSQLLADMGDLRGSIIDQCKVLELSEKLDSYVFLYDLTLKNAILSAARENCLSYSNVDE